MGETLRGNPNNQDSGTLRGKPQSTDGTLRGKPQNTDGTLRGKPQNTDGTLRGTPQNTDGTLRGKPDNGGTLRGNAGGGDGTLRGKQDLGKTARGPVGGSAPQGVKPAAKPTMQGLGQQKPSDNKPKTAAKGLQPSPIDTFDLNGVTYTVDGIISASTGEAEIYCLSKGARKYALKLYYAGYYPEQQVIKALLQAQGTGFLVDVIEYGQWQSPTGESREYELMPYYTGGDLRPGMLAGNPSDLKAIALAMIMAVKTAHDHKILHRDIKPGNFMYTDDSHAQLILTDFGIASMFDTDAKGRMRPLKTRAQFRTKIYAAPETYVTIDGEIQYDDVKSDYYSLGITLLTLWMGEEPFAGYDERTLLRMKKGESGTLPIADDMPAELQHMVKGLTVANPDKRWGFDEFERWLRGEDVPVEGMKQQSSGLNIMYSGSKNQVATTFEELVQFMLEDRKLAKQYLYGGKLSRWLADAGYPELQIQIDEFVNKTYPKDQDAGLMAAAYLLDGDLPYEAPTGNKLRTNAEIANDMVYHANDYLRLMKDPNSSLYVYFRAAGINYADDFVPVANDMELKALWRMIFTLNPDSPFPLVGTDMTYSLFDTPAQLVDFYAKMPNGFFYTNNSAYPLLLLDEAFFIWLGHRDAALAGKIKSKLSQETYNPGIYDYIFYLLDPARNYHFASDQSADFTFQQVVSMLARDMETINKGRVQSNVPELADAQDRIAMWQNLSNNRLFYYFKSKELYKDNFDYITAVFDLQSKEHQDQPGPYDLDIATYKSIKAFAGNVNYYFPKSSTSVKNISQLDKVSDAEKTEELNKGKLKAWLAVQYQEDPGADFSTRYTYEGSLAEYTAKLGEIDPTTEEAQRTIEALDLIESQASKCRSLATQVIVLRVIWGLLLALPLVAVAVLSIVMGYPQMAHPVGLGASLMLAGGAVVFLRAVQILPGLDYLVQNCCNVRLGDYFDDHKWLCSIFYAVAFGALAYLLDHYGHNAGFIIMPVFCLLLLWLLYDSCIHSMPLMLKGCDDCLHPDDEALVVEPLYYGWKDKGTNKDFESQTLERQDIFIEATKDERNKLIGRTLMGLLPVAVTVAIYIFASPFMANWLKDNDPVRFAKLYADGTVEGIGKSTVTYYADVKNSLTVRAQPSKSAAAIGSLGRKQEMEVIAIDPNTGFAEILWKDGTGYVSANYIKPVQGIEATDTPDQDKKDATSSTSKDKSDASSSNKDSAKNNSSADSKTESPQAAPEQKNADAAKTSSPSNIYTVKSNYGSIMFYSAPQSHIDNVAGEISPGETFKVLDPSAGSNFAKVEYKGQIGYVQSYQIQKAE